jgi:hypothetical protein
MPSGEQRDFSVIHKWILQVLEDGKVRYTKHGGNRTDVRGFQTPDLEHVIRFGRIVAHRVSQKHPGPSYSIEGFTVEGIKIRCAVAIDGDVLLIVTVHRCR